LCQSQNNEQTNAANTDDADIFVENKPSGGFGIATAGSGYFGVIEPDKYYRLGLVFLLLLKMVS
jgi:hypothetical protein